MKTSEERGRLMLCSDTFYNTIFNTIYTKLTSWACFSLYFYGSFYIPKKNKKHLYLLFASFTFKENKVCVFIPQYSTRTRNNNDLCGHVFKPFGYQLQDS